MVEHNNTVSIKFRSIWRISLLTIRTCMLDEKSRVLWSAHARHVLGQTVLRILVRCTKKEIVVLESRGTEVWPKTVWHGEGTMLHCRGAGSQRPHCEMKSSRSNWKKKHNNLMKQIILLFHVWIHLPHCFLFAIIKTWKRREKTVYFCVDYSEKSMMLSWHIGSGNLYYCHKDFIPHRIHNVFFSNSFHMQ